MPNVSYQSVDRIWIRIN